MRTQWLFVPLGRQDKLVVPNTAGGVSLTPPSGATHMMISVLANDIWYTTDGTTPVTGPANTGVGTYAQGAGAASKISFMDANINYQQMIQQFKAIALAAGTSILNIEYYRAS